MTDELERQYALTKGKGNRKDRGSGGSTGSARSSRSTHKTAPAFSSSKSFSERSSRSSSRPHSPTRTASSHPGSPPTSKRSIIDVFALPASSSSSFSAHPQSPIKFPMSPFVRTEAVTSSATRLSSAALLVLLLVGVGVTMLVFSSLSLPSASTPAPTAPGMRSVSIHDREITTSKLATQRSGPLQRLIGSLEAKDAQRLSPDSSLPPSPPQPPQSQLQSPEEANWDPGFDDLGADLVAADGQPAVAAVPAPEADELTPMQSDQQQPQQNTQQFAEQLQPMQQQMQEQQQLQEQMQQDQMQDQQQPVAGLDLLQDPDSPVLTPLPRSVGGLASSGFIFDSSYSFVLLAPAPLPPSVRVLAATWARLIARPLTIFSDAPDDELAAFVVVLQDPHPERARWTGPSELDQSLQSDGGSSNLPVEDVNNDQAAEGAEHLHSGASLSAISGQRDVIWMLPQAIAYLAAAATTAAANAAAASSASASASASAAASPAPLDPPAFYFLLTDSRIFPLLDAMHSKLTAYRASLSPSSSSGSLPPLPSFVGAGSETSIARESYWSEDAWRARQLYPPAEARSRLTTVVPGLVGFSAAFLTSKLAAAAADPQCPLLAPESLALGGLVACAGGFPADSALFLFRLSNSSPWSLEFNAATTSLHRWRAEGDAYRLGGDSSEESDEAWRAYYEKNEAEGNGNSELQIAMQAQ